MLFLLVICSCFALMANLTACDDPTTGDDGGTDGDGTGVSSEVWEEAQSPDNFDNVTFGMDVNFTTPAEGGQSYIEIKLADDAVAMKEGVDGDYSVTTNADIVASVKSVYVNTVLAIVDNFADFTHNATNNCYNGNKDIVYSVEVQGIAATITAKDVVVELNAENGIAKIACEMTQEFVERGVSQTYVLDVEFTFFNYGTTVVTAD